MSISSIVARVRMILPQSCGAPKRRFSLASANGPVSIPAPGALPRSATAGSAWPRIACMRRYQVAPKGGTFPMNDCNNSQQYDNPTAHSEEFDRSLLRSIQEASPDGILVVDGEFRVVSYNQQFLTVWR